MAFLAAACDDDDTGEEPILPADAGQLADGAPQAGADGAPPGADAAMPIAVTVRMQNDQFLPQNVTVRVGQTIHWVNDDDELHTVTSGMSSNLADMPGQLFDAQTPAGGTFDFTPSGVGNIPFFCRIHELLGMRGTITVTP